MTPTDAETLAAGAAEVVPTDGLRDKLALGRPLRVKLGLDPTAGHVTLGWAVVLRALRRFQDAGHIAVLIVGDFTARVGDPSGRSETRPRLSKEEVDGYAERLLGQFWTILDRERAEVRRNSEWLEGLGMEGVLELTANATVARMLERDDFAKRFAANRPISLMEFLYPLLQGYDSVAVRADVELGGTDQTFNLLVGRDLQRAFGQEPQVAYTLPLLEGLDGVAKMSQSLGNYVGITEEPDEQFAKLLRIPDGLIPKYLRLCADAGEDEAAAVERGLADGSIAPMAAKRAMARAVVDLYHGAGSGASAEASFDRVHRDRELPEEVPGRSVRRSEIVREVAGAPVVSRAALLQELDLVSSRSEGRRLIAQGGVKVDGVAVEEDETTEGPEALLGTVWQVGRRRFARVESLV
ncbi:MAG: tyrosine--tRNA ligase [Actinomycetota bacterium]